MDAPVPECKSVGQGMNERVRSLAGVAHVEVIHGAEAAPEAEPMLLLEVPHGADREVDYDLLRQQLVGTFPSDLKHFFFVNTDVGAWALARAIAASVIEQYPSCSVLLVRSLLPRTFVDCNRNTVSPPPSTQTPGALTPGLPSYVDDPTDRALLQQVHSRYVSLTDDACRWVLHNNGGLGMVVHSYAPRTVGIQQVDHNIVSELHRVYAPEVVESWPLRPEVDLITQDQHGRRLCPDGAVDAITRALAEQDVHATECATYHLHSSSRAATMSQQYPSRVMCFEVRRDLLVDAWTPFSEMLADRNKVSALAVPFADFAVDWLQRTA